MIVSVNGEDYVQRNEVELKRWGEGEAKAGESRTKSIDPCGDQGIRELAATFPPLVIHNIKNKQHLVYSG
jgi:hypothetical protein